MVKTNLTQTSYYVFELYTQTHSIVVQGLSIGTKDENRMRSWKLSSSLLNNHQRQ